MSERMNRAIVPIAVMAALMVTLETSNVPPNLAVVQGQWAVWTIQLYVCMLGAAVWKPDSVKIHVVAALVGTVAWAGRAGGFMELVASGRSDLKGAVAERLAIAVVMVWWHSDQLHYIAQHKEVT